MSRKKKDQKPPDWVEEPDVQKLPQQEGETLIGEASVPTQVATQVKSQEIGTLDQIKAQTFAKLVKEKGIVEAAKEVGERQWKQFANREEVQKEIMKVIQKGHLPPEARRLFERASVNLIALEAMASTNPMDKKTALDALKMIAMDTEVGIQQPVQAAVSINLSVLKDVLETSGLPDVELDGEVVEAVAEEKKE